MPEAKIILVDDEAPFVDVMAERLNKRGFEVVKALNGDEALKRLREQADIEVAVVDLKMPGMDGLELLVEMKRLRPLLEVVMLTGHGTVETAVEGIRQGAFDYLLKPCEMESLLEKLRAAAGRHRRHEDQVITYRSLAPKMRRQMLADMDTAVRRALGIEED